MSNSTCQEYQANFVAEPSTLAKALLGLLASEPMTGYELTRTFDQSLAHVWSAKHGQIYPELAKLQAAGLIRQVESGPRGSKRYAATEDGVEAVRRWLRETVPSEAIRNEGLLRVFFLWLLSPDDARAYLTASAARHRERLERYRQIATYIPADGAPADRWSRIALEAGIRYEEAMAGWSEWAAREVPDTPG